MPVKFKDPIYGYIKIDEWSICEIISSPQFHRLEDIIQTSYSSVFPSSLHNRFIHSIGVFYLGRLAVDGMKSNFQGNVPKDFNIYADVFKLACLMHDIGHSPFSHTGEKYYMAPDTDLWQKLKGYLKDKQFDADATSVTGAPHEIMSALHAIKEFSDKIDDAQKAFFVRCIIGLKYSDTNDIRNCFIELLNSKTIDVDKLDYLIRDSYFTGFKTVSIDYERLLSSICVIKKDDGYKLGFTKTGLSTLESVILAHDMERKWIQNHPTIQYEIFLIEKIISRVVDLYKKEGVNLFSRQALTCDGIENKNGYTVRLFSDSDILYMAKNKLFSEQTVQEFFIREKRRKPLWKTEAEYRTYFENGDMKEGFHEKFAEMLESLKKTLEKYFNSFNKIPLINDDFLEFLELEVQCNKNSLQGNLKNEILRKKILGENKNLERIIGLVKKIKDFSNGNLDYAFITAKQFSSGFNKDELKKIIVKFDENRSVELGMVVNLFEQEKPKDNFFYFYVNKKKQTDFDVPEFSKIMKQYVNEKF